MATEQVFNPQIGLIQERPRPSSMSRLANGKGSGEDLYPVFHRSGVFTLKMSKYDQNISPENAFGEVGFYYPPPLGRLKNVQCRQRKCCPSIDPPPLGWSKASESGRV